jgi:hypothetical protein
MRALSLTVLPPLIWAQSPPDNLRACAAERDRDARLACYDREMGRAGKPDSGTAGKPDSGMAGKTDSGTAGKTKTAPSPAPQERAAEDRPGVIDRARGMIRKATGQDGAANEPDVSAHVVSVQGLPNEMVLRLDNGEVWQQLEGNSELLGLRAGDSVTIRKRLGSYWLSGPHVSSVKVRQKP